MPAPALIPRSLDDALDGLARPADPDRGQAPRAQRREASRLLRRLRRGGDWRVLAGPVLRLLMSEPHDGHLQRIAAGIIGQGGRALSEASWRGVAARHPGSVEAFVRHVDAVIRYRGVEGVAALFARRFGSPSSDPIERTMAGLILERLGRRPEAETAFRAALSIDADNPLGWGRLSALIDARGDAPAAAAALAEGRRVTRDASLNRRPSPPPAVRQTRAVVTRTKAIPELAIEPWREPLTHLLATATEVRRSLAPRPDRIGAIVMIGGSLGGGGAERQLVATALGAAAAADAGATIGRTPVRGPVTIFCRRLAARGGHDFFLPALAAAGVPVQDYLAMPRWGGDVRRSLLKGDRQRIESLPERMREGTERLTDALAALAPDVVQIWQDGMIVAAGLAAALAGVPRIVLNVRTLPPNQRTERWKPELEPLYRGLLALPGIVLTANSALAARAYEDWLGCATGSVAVVPNGVRSLDYHGVDAAEAATWRTFDAATGGGFTVGGVMRFDANKRPLEWLGIAEAFLRSEPGARFILVGDGELGAVTREFARHRGLTDRLLLVGRSRHVGWWLARMDAMLLTSRFEGTPNVLIEAQLAGLPVVTTPAGAAIETIVPGITGFVLTDAEHVNTAEAVTHLRTIAGWSEGHRRHVSELAQRSASARYSVEAMLSRSLELFAANGVSG